METIKNYLLKSLIILNWCLYKNICDCRIKAESSYLERGHESRLVIDNVTYDYQGEYECRATNFINGQERTVASEPVSLQVVGMFYNFYFIN